MNINIECKYCSSPIEVPLNWAKQNGRVYCPTCSKSFDVVIQMTVDEAKQEDKTVEATINKDSEVVHIKELNNTLIEDPNAPKEESQFEELMGGYFV